MITHSDVKRAIKKSDKSIIEDPFVIIRDSTRIEALNIVQYEYFLVQNNKITKDDTLPDEIQLTSNEAKAMIGLFNMISCVRTKRAELFEVEGQPFLNKYRGTGMVKTRS